MSGSRAAAAAAAAAAASRVHSVHLKCNAGTVDALPLALTQLASIIVEIGDGYITMHPLSKQTIENHTESSSVRADLRLFAVVLRSGGGNEQPQ